MNLIQLSIISLLFTFSASTSWADCFASTRCDSGRRISCSAYGTGSTCYEAPGDSVTCIGKSGFNGQITHTIIACSEYEKGVHKLSTPITDINASTDASQ